MSQSAGGEGGGGGGCIHVPSRFRSHSNKANWTLMSDDLVIAICVYIVSVIRLSLDSLLGLFIDSVRALLLECS